MKSTSANEPAFPSSSLSGMTMREWLAGQALAGLLSATVADESEGGTPLLYWKANAGLTWNHDEIPVMVARMAYKMADAMIAMSKEGGK